MAMVAGSEWDGSAGWRLCECVSVSRGAVVAE